MSNPRLKVSAKGQVTLRRAVLAHLGVEPGDRLVAELLPGGRVEVRAEARGSIEDFFGFLAPADTPALTLDAIAESTAAAGAGER